MNNLIKNVVLSPFNLLYKVSPSICLKLLFRLKQGYKLNLKEPVTYNEKLQWVKLYDRNSLMPICCDKFRVREYVSDKGCGELLNELYWEGFDPEDIPFDILPNKFVIKVTHGSTFNIICKDKNNFDRKVAVKKCKKWLKAKFLPCYGEWFYGIEKPRVIVEKFIESDDGEQLRDYKVFCFNGRAKYIRVDSDRFTCHKANVFTDKWELLPEFKMGFENSDYTFSKPAQLEKMLEYAEKLSSDFLHARIDFYIAQGRLWFGEITFTNGAGFDKFSKECDLALGKCFKLPKVDR